MPYRDLKKARDQSRAWYAANRERAKARRAAYYAANKEKIRARQKATAGTKEGRAKQAARARRWRAKNPDRVSQINKASKARRGYSSTADQRRRRERIAGSKPDTCDACGRGGKIVFDHCHRGARHSRDRSTKALSRFRGWLCERCNVALGMVDNDPEILRGLIDYLARAESRLPDI